MKKLLSVYLEEDGSLSVVVSPVLGVVFKDKEELFDSFDSEVIADETQKLLNAVGKKLGITE